MMEGLNDGLQGGTVAVKQGLDYLPAVLAQVARLSAAERERRKELVDLTLNLEDPHHARGENTIRPPGSERRVQL